MQTGHSLTKAITPNVVHPTSSAFHDNDILELEHTRTVSDKMHDGAIVDLPGEILVKICEQTSPDNGQVDQEASSRIRSLNNIKNLHLVSRRFAIVSSAFLIEPATVELSSLSFVRLEEICSHPHFCESVTKIMIDLSFYDVSFSSEQQRYFECCAWRLSNMLYGDLGSASNLLGFDDHLEDQWNFRNRRVGEIMSQLHRLAHTEAELMEPQRVLMTKYGEYVSRTSDQQDLRQDNKHIERSCTCLSQLPILERIEFFHPHDLGVEIHDDSIQCSGDILSLPDSLYAFALEKTHGHALLAFPLPPQAPAEPPAEMLCELMSRLDEANIRPYTINVNVDVDLNVFAYLTPLRVNKQQIFGLRKIHLALLNHGFVP